MMCFCYRLMYISLKHFYFQISSYCYFRNSDLVWSLASFLHAVIILLSVLFHFSKFKFKNIICTSQTVFRLNYIRYQLVFSVPLVVVVVLAVFWWNTRGFVPHWDQNWPLCSHLSSSIREQLVIMPVILSRYNNRFLGFFFQAPLISL